MKIQVEFRETGAGFDLGFEGDSRFDIGFEEGLPGHSAPSYSGEYEVIPRVTEQRLPTRDRQLARDILVHAIPYHEVENTERGTTAIIGGI